MIKTLLLSVALMGSDGGEKPVVVFKLKGWHTTRAERIEIRKIKRQRKRVVLVRPGYRYDPVIGRVVISKTSL